MHINFSIPQAEVCQGGMSFMTKFVLVKNMTDRVILGNPFLCLLYPFITDNEGITAHPFNQPVKFGFIRSPELWEVSSLQKASISRTLNTLTAHNQAQNLDSAKTIDYPFDSNQLLSCIHICIPASISFKRKKIFNKPLKILFHPKLSWQEKVTMTSPAEKKGKGKVPVRDYPQDKRLPATGQSFVKHEGALLPAIEEQHPFKLCTQKWLHIPVVLWL